MLNRNIESSWNVMAHGDTQEEKWRGNKRMEWVTSKCHMTAERRLAQAVQTLQADVYSSPASSRLNWRPPQYLSLCWKNHKYGYQKDCKNCIYLCIYDCFHILLSMWHIYGSKEWMYIRMHVCMTMSTKVAEGATSKI